MVQSALKSGVGEGARRIQTGELVPKITIKRPGVLPRVAETVANLPGAVVNTIAGKGITAPISDVARVTGNYIKTGGQYIPYKDLNSGAARIGYQAAAKIRPSFAKEAGVKTGASDIIGDVGRTVEPIVSASGIGKAGQVAKESGKQTLKIIIKQGAKEGAKQGAMYGAVSSLDQNRDRGVRDQIIQATKDAILGGAFGAAAGATIPVVSVAGKKLFRVIIKKATSETPVVVKVKPEGKSSAKVAKSIEEEIEDILPKETPMTQSPTGQQIPVGTKERGFVTTVKKSPITASPVAENVTGYYGPITNKQTIAEADRIIAGNFDDAMRIALEGPSTATNNAVALRLIDKFQTEGNYQQAVNLIEQLAKKPTSQGQAIQILSYYNKLTPVGALRFAQTLVDRANQGKTSGFIKVGEVAAKRIQDLAKEAGELPEGRAKLLKTAELAEEIHQVVPKSVLQKISTIQTLAQLLNPKTALRNVVGNAGFAVGENVSNVAAVPLDIATSLVTGKRTRILPSVTGQARSFGLGLKEGVEEALKGVNTQPGVKNQFDMPATQTFRDPILGTLEKALSVELRAPDRAFYRAARDEALRQQMKIAGVAEPTDEMLQLAHKEGLYRTFQDDTVLTRLFTGVKRALNIGKDWGLGDVVLKYPKTPAALISRGLDYSPAGFIKTVAKMADPLIGRPFDQKEFVDSFSRALVGTGGLMTTGAILQKLGVITGRPEKDKDISAVQREAGMGAYRINASALKRLVMSGFDVNAAKPQNGDMLVSYDWFQPYAIGLSMGANVAENNGKIESGGQVATILDSLQGGIETLAEQPLVKGVRQLFQGYDPVSAVVGTLKSVPASFVPGLVNQVNQLFGDNINRNTYDPNPLKESVNMAVAKIPGFAETLPKRYDIYGKEQERFQDGSNTPFNVFLNPAFMSRLKADPASQEILNMFTRSGETQQAPRIVPKKVTINGEDRVLTAQEQGAYQQYVGQLTNVIFNDLVTNEKFASFSDEDKAKAMADFLTDINTAAKIDLFGHRPERVDKGVKEILGGSYTFDRLKSTEEKELGKGYKGGGSGMKPKKPSPGKGKSVTLKIKKTAARKSPKIRISFPKVALNLPNPKPNPVTYKKGAVESLRKAPPLRTV